jgi:hypothetical protein
MRDTLLRSLLRESRAAAGALPARRCAAASQCARQTRRLASSSPSPTAKSAAPLPLSPLTAVSAVDGR